MKDIKKSTGILEILESEENNGFIFRSMKTDAWLNSLSACNANVEQGLEFLHKLQYMQLKGIMINVNTDLTRHLRQIIDLNFAASIINTRYLSAAHVPELGEQFGPAHEFIATHGLSTFPDFIFKDISLRTAYNLWLRIHQENILDKPVKHKRVPLWFRKELIKACTNTDSEEVYCKVMLHTRKTYKERIKFFRDNLVAKCDCFVKKELWWSCYVDLQYKDVAIKGATEGKGRCKREDIWFEYVVSIPYQKLLAIRKKY